MVFLHASLMKIEIPYGRGLLPLNLPKGTPLELIEAPAVPPASDPLGTARSALDEPLGGVSLSTFAGAQSAAIAISDKTRPVPHQHLLPPLLERLESIGIPRGAIRLFVALGTHPSMTADELAATLPGSILERYQVISHDTYDGSRLVHLGETSRGTPVWVNREYAHSELKVVVGNIEPHQFAGFSGGVKSAAIGLAGIDTITHNHALMTRSGASLGSYENNPLHQDIEEIGRMIGVQFACNAILNGSRQIVHVLAGDPRAVMSTGIPLSRKVCQVEVQSKYGLVIASPGGHPKDINLYQAQKGFSHAALVTRTGGTVLLAAACPEGTGNPDYEAWMKGKRSYEGILQQFSQEGFRIGPHKAYQIARDASRVRLRFYSEMNMELSTSLLLNPVTDLQEALDEALAEIEPGESIGFLPHAASTIPYVKI
jgi:nickel-dependent lactate racemase